MLKHRVKGDTKVLFTKVTKFSLFSVLHAEHSAVFMSFRMSEPRAKRMGITPRIRW